MITRRQKSGDEPMVKVQKKFRKKKQKKVHNNFLTMVLLMPLYAYLQDREAAYMLYRIEQGAKLDTNTTINDYDDEDVKLVLSSSDDDDMPFSVLCAKIDAAPPISELADSLIFTDTSIISESQEENLDSTTEQGSKNKTNFKKFVKKNDYTVIKVFKNSKYKIYICH